MWCCYIAKTIIVERLYMGLQFGGGGNLISPQNISSLFTYIVIKFQLTMFHKCNGVAICPCVMDWFI
jgi:hypothetical protein